eukprot:gene790-857_t
MSSSILFLFLALFLVVIDGAYIIGYQRSSNDHQDIVNAGASFVIPPSAEQVADLYSRVSGYSPILWEDKENLPGANPLSNKIVQAKIIEVVGGVLPEEVTTIAEAMTTVRPPALEDVVNVLNQYGIHAETETFDATGDKLGDVYQYLSNQKVPVFILHHTLESPQRRLTTSSNVTELSEFQISQYQICLWAAVAFVLMLAYSISSMINMEVEPDSLLYAKFQSGRTENKRD